MRRNKRISIHHIGDVGYFGLNNYVSKRGLNMAVYYAYQQTLLNIIIEIVVGNAAERICEHRWHRPTLPAVTWI